MQPIVAGDSMRHQGGSAEITPADCVRKHVGEKTFSHWFDSRTTFRTEGDCLLIGVATAFMLPWFQKNFRKSLQAAAVELLGLSGNFEVFVDPDAAASTDETPNAADTRSTASGPAAEPVRIHGHRRFARLADFVSGECNQLAFVAANQIASNPGGTYNPFFVYGKAGTGKTHLLEGIYSEVRRRFRESQVLYLTSEAFINYFTQAQRERSMPSFRQRFRNVDVLILDDIDFLDAKRGTQEELLHTLTQLQSHGRQVVVSADRHPRMLEQLRDELTTRFTAGLVCRLDTPDEVTRVEFLRRKSEQLPARFHRDALGLIASRFKSNMRELEGALNSLNTYFEMTGERITRTVACSVLGEQERDYQRLVSVVDIESEVGRTFGVTARELRSATRARRVSQPRMLAMYLARRLTQAAYEEIGRYFGNRNHSTVMSAERRVREWISEGKELRIASQIWRADELIDDLEHRLLAG